AQMIEPAPGAWSVARGFCVSTSHSLMVTSFDQDFHVANVLPSAEYAAPETGAGDGSAPRACPVARSQTVTLLSELGAAKLVPSRDSAKPCICFVCPFSVTAFSAARSQS